MTMLQELYDELQSIYAAKLDGAAQSGIVDMPEHKASTTFIFVNRSDAGCWYTLNIDGSPNYIPVTKAVRGRVTDVQLHEKSSEDYGDKTYLRVGIATEQGTYVIQSGFETAFAEGLVHTLNAYSASELSDICIGVKPSEATTGKQAKIVFCEVKKPDGSWQKADREKSYAQAFDELTAKLSGKPVSKVVAAINSSAEAPKKDISKVKADPAFVSVPEAEDDFPF